MTQPKLDPNHPVVEVEVTASTYAGLAPAAVEQATTVFGPGRYAAVLIGRPPQVETETDNRAHAVETTRVIGITARFQVGTEWTR